MWLMTRHGFFSVTASAAGTHQWRARDEAHLEALRSRFNLGHHRIHITPDADYRYRIILGTRTSRTLIGSLVDDIDYPNFKDAAAKEWGKDDPYTEALTAVWRTMGELQPGGPYNWDTWQYHDSDDWDDEPMGQER